HDPGGRHRDLLARRGVDGPHFPGLRHAGSRAQRPAGHTQCGPADSVSGGWPGWKAGPSAGKRPRRLPGRLSFNGTTITEVKRDALARWPKRPFIKRHEKTRITDSATAG